MNSEILRIPAFTVSFPSVWLFSHHALPPFLFLICVSLSTLPSSSVPEDSTVYAAAAAAAGLPFPIFLHTSKPRRRDSPALARDSGLPGALALYDLAWAGRLAGHVPIFFCHRVVGEPDAFCVVPECIGLLGPPIDFDRDLGPIGKRLPRSTK